MSAAIFTTWASISSWFTPSVLFCLLNLTIFAIFLFNFQSYGKNHSDHNPIQFARAPSKELDDEEFCAGIGDLIIRTKKELKLHGLDSPSSYWERKNKFLKRRYDHPDPNPHSKLDHVTRSKSDTTGEGEGHVAAAAAARMRKSASEKWREAEDLQQHSGGRRDDVAKSFCSTYDPGIHTADSIAPISFEVLETLPTREQPNDCVPLLSPGRLTLEDCVQQEKSPDLPRVTQINKVEQRLSKLHRYLGGLTAQKWATRKGYALGGERPFEVRRLSMDEKLDSRLQLIHMSQLARSSPRALALPEGGEIVRPTALSSSEFAATNNRAHLVSQDQSGSIASHYKCKNSRETSDKQGLEGRQQHFCCEHEHALKSLGVSGSMFKSTCRQHWFYWWQGRFKSNEQQAFDATSNRAHLVKADERGPTVSNALFLEDLQHQFGARCKDAVKGLHDSLAWKSFKVQDNLPLGEQSNTRWRSLTHKHCVRLKKSQDLPRSMLRDCAGGLAAQSDIGLPDGGHILFLSEKKIVRKTLKRKCRTMSVLSLEDHQQHVGRRWEDTVKFLGAKRICRQLVIHHKTTAKRIRRQLGTRWWLFKQSAFGLPDGGHILYLPEKKIVRKTLKRKYRSISVLSLEDHKHVDRRWEDAAKSHGTKRIRRQLVIHRLSTAKRTHKQHGIHQWPFQRSAIGLPDGGHIVSLSEKKIVRKTLKRKCRSMSVLSLVDCQQHVDRRWKDAAKNIGAKRICRQLVMHRVSIAKRICKQHGIHHRWPFERDWATMKGYSLGYKRPVEVIHLSIDGKLVSRLRRIYISWLGRFSPRPSALPRGGLIVGPIALSSSEFAATNNLAQCVGQDQRGSGASGSENERTREQEDSEEIRTSITKDDLLQLHGWMTRNDAAAILHVSVSTLKRKCKQYGIGPWENGGNKRVLRPPDPHGKRNTSTACETPSHNVQPGMEGEPVGQNQEANVFRQDFMRGPIAMNTESGSIMVSRPTDQHGERNTSTARETPSHNVQTGIEGVLVGQNQEANEFRPDFMEGSIPLNTVNGLIIGSSSEWASHVNDQSTLSNPHVVFPQPQITSLQSENRGGSIDLRNSLASQAALFSDGHISGSSNLAFPSQSDQAAPSQHVEVWRPLDQHGERSTSTARETPSHNVQTVIESVPVGQNQEANEFRPDFMEGSIALNTENVLITGSSFGFPPPQITSMPIENMGGSIDLRNSLANLTFATCFDQAAPSQHVQGQSMHPTVYLDHNVFRQTQMVSSQEPFSEGRVIIKAFYQDADNTKIKFPFPLTSGIVDLKKEVSKRLNVEVDRFVVKYKDKYEDLISILCDDDVEFYLLSSRGKDEIRVFVDDKVGGTFCESCRSLMQRRA